MALTNHQKIGTHFKKENIFLATVSATQNNLKMGLPEGIYENLLEAGVDVNKCLMFDVFYKEGDVYLRFFEEGVETYAGDNSDGMGTLRNIVPVWDYFLEDELYETRLADGSMAIGFTNEMSLYKYSKEYSMKFETT